MYKIFFFFVIFFIFDYIKKYENHSKPETKVQNLIEKSSCVVKNFQKLSSSEITEPI